MRVNLFGQPFVDTDLLFLNRELIDSGLAYEGIEIVYRHYSETAIPFRLNDTTRRATGIELPSVYAGNRDALLYIGEFFPNSVVFAGQAAYFASQRVTLIY